MNILKRISQKAKQFDYTKPQNKAYLKAYYQGIKNRNTFKNVDAFCLFIGYQRSGHSIVGSLLDAHPNVAIAHELNILKYFEAGYTQQQIYYLLWQNAQEFSEAGRQWSGYSYQVPNQWQGKVQTLKVIGDKKGALTAIKLSSNPKLFELMQKKLNVPIKFVHVVRNPYDNIATMFRKKDWKHRKADNLEGTINNYFELCKNIDSIKQIVPTQQIFDLKHETLIANPKQSLKDLCNFFGLETANVYLENCASIVFKSPHQSRTSIEWSDELIELVKSEIDKFSFLNGYSYKD